MGLHFIKKTKKKLKMEEIIRDLLSVVKGLPSLLSFMSVMVIFIIYIFKDSIKKIITKIKLPNIFKKKKIKSLLFHDLFNECIEIKNKVNQMQFCQGEDKHPIKSEMMRILINKKMDVVISEVTIFLQSEDVMDMDSNEIKFRFKKSLNGLVLKYNDLAYQEYIRMGISHQDSLYFINRYEDYRSVVIEGFIDRLDSIASNNSYSSNYDKLTCILELCTLAMSIIPRDIRSIYIQINGKYDKYNIYKI